MSFSRLLRLFLLCAAISAAIVVSIHWIDRPLARGLESFHLGYRVFTSRAVQLPVMTSLAAAGLLLGLGFLISGRKPPRVVEAVMLAGIAVLAGQVLTHDVLKPIFGRPTPGAYLHSGHHGFHWFHGGWRFGSFPSGHSTEASAMLAVAWIYYPRLRWLCAGAMALLALALMLGQWHYLSDIIAGTAVGSTVGTLVTLGWRRLMERRRAG